MTTTISPIEIRTETRRIAGQDVNCYRMSQQREKVGESGRSSECRRMTVWSLAEVEEAKRTTFA